MVNKERVAIYIDGSNLYYKFKDKELGVPNTTSFDYLGLCKFLAREREIVSLRYYVGIVRAKKDDTKGQGLRKAQQKLLNKLTNKGFIIKSGYLMNNGGKYHEKGVDVRLALDLVIGAYEDFYDTAILISSDTDLIPAIKKVKFREKDVEYVGFAHSPSLGIQKNVKISRLLIKEDFEPYIFKPSYEGVIIEESLRNKDILGEVEVVSTKVEPVTEGHKTDWVKQWTLHTVKIPQDNAGEVAETISKSLDGEHSWYADYKTDTEHYIIFRDKVFHITDRSNKEQYDEATKYGQTLGIPEYQLDFSPHIKQWKRKS